MKNILVTGARGFVGKNLVETLKTIKDGKNRTHPNLKIGEIFEYDINSSEEDLEYYCDHADLVCHFAGVNRPKNTAEFWTGNVGFTKKLLHLMEKKHNQCPVVLSSSIQADLTGRFEGSEYGKSKREAERIVDRYGEINNVPVFIHRFPNLAGKWIKPDYNSAIGTFCHHIANDMPIQISNPKTKLEILFIDDLIEIVLNNLEGKIGPVIECEQQDGIKYFKPIETHDVTLGEIVQWLELFRMQPKKMMIPDIPDKSFQKKLWSMYLSYLPENKTVQSLHVNGDSRGSFTELLKTREHGQVSINVAKPGITKGGHWHNTKWEIFIVVSGMARIRQQRVGTNEQGKKYPVIETVVSGDDPKAVYILPGYTHDITNISESENLVTVMWANELFDPKRPDTYWEPIE